MISANFTYDSFDEETKKYLNRAIDMYLLIKGKNLSFYHKDIIRGGDRDLSLQDFILKVEIKQKNHLMKKLDLIWMSIVNSLV